MESPAIGLRETLLLSRLDVDIVTHSPSYWYVIIDRRRHEFSWLLQLIEAIACHIVHRDRYRTCMMELINSLDIDLIELVRLIVYLFFE